MTVIDRKAEANTCVLLIPSSKISWNHVRFVYTMQSISALVIQISSNIRSVVLDGNFERTNQPVGAPP